MPFSDTVTINTGSAREAENMAREEYIHISFDDGDLDVCAEEIEIDN